jgi:hypothetical protein
MSNLPTSVLESFHDGLKTWCLHAIVLSEKGKHQIAKHKEPNNVDIESGKINTKLQST